MVPLLIVLGIVVIVGVITAAIYNGLVSRRNQVDNAWSQIDVQLKQRADLVPQLVSTVKGYAVHEKEVLQRVTEARALGLGATTINEKMQADNMLTQALAGLKVSLEAYPDLKANQNFMNLQTEISDIENKLAAVRRYFNTATRELNNAVQTFPSNVFANMFGFKKEPMYEIDTTQRAEAEKAPDIKF